MNKVITISREYGAGGHTIGKQVAQELGLPVRVVRTAYGQLRRSGVQIGHILPPEDDTMASRLPPEVYLALQRMVTGHADT